MSDMTVGSSCEVDSGTRVTRSLLGYGVLAGPLYVVVILAQVLFLRPAFDLAHDDTSLLANGSLGWIQVANLVLTGLMVVACAVGVRRALGTTWAPLLLALVGLGMVGAGIFVADPMGGFPPGTPAGRPTSISPHGMLHIVSAGIGFLAFAAACFAIAGRYRKWFSRLTGLLFLAGFAGLASGSSSAAVVLAFWAVLILAFTWLATLSVTLYRRVA